MTSPFRQNPPPSQWPIPITLSCSSKHKLNISHLEEWLDGHSKVRNRGNKRWEKGGIECVPRLEQHVNGVRVNFSNTLDRVKEENIELLKALIKRKPAKVVDVVSTGTTASSNFPGKLGRRALKEDDQGDGGKKRATKGMVLAVNGNWHLNFEFSGADSTRPEQLIVEAVRRGDNELNE
ncbi:hypothetical protein C8F04DRAFT_1176822 [Mycena alexandri]|uniref:Uncharacterized protein n=1 Tax=Mycena alexandri TaxID=1745969 RepID=A0AAD6T8F1_9AGAR|nr:hypothetical protein C8F04DRAFT_1176822 [Mycena alexandri]